MKNKLIISRLLALSLSLVVDYIIATAGYVAKIDLVNGCISEKEHLEYWSVAWYGEGAKEICIDLYDGDICTQRIFESCGCSSYYVNKNSSRYEISIYSMLDFRWPAECCLEDRRPYDIYDADIVYTLIYDKEGIRGSINILGGNRYAIFSDPGFNDIAIDWDYTLAHPEMFCYYIGRLVHLYIDHGYTNTEIYDFLNDFENSLSSKGIRPEPESTYLQEISLYRFALLNSGRELKLEDFKTLGTIMCQVNESR